MLIHRLRHSRATWLVGGLIVGLVLGGYWPDTPSYAVATDRYEDYAIATGFVDDDIEAVYFFDFLTGNLQAAVLSIQTGQFTATYERNVMQDLEVSADKKPRYLMVTGAANLRKSGQVRLGSSVVYICDATSGVMAAYAIPWVGGQKAANARVDAAPLVPLNTTKFRTAAVRE